MIVNTTADRQVTPGRVYIVSSYGGAITLSEEVDGTFEAIPNSAVLDGTSEQFIFSYDTIRITRTAGSPNVKLVPVQN
jgi:hypothetical protein